ncbi:MAG: polyphosphate polymerase domain-containing protein [Deltaproteobacteria bacterium]|nr:polyphosphate polymerase domain-containing protein [Deltaproteobacteria bacterium]
MSTVRRFNRYELKYLLPAARAEAIMADLREMTEPDSHGGEDGYRVVSLYYDSPGLDFFWAKIEGIKFRRKLRLRVYPGPGGVESIRSGMVEIKQRINRTVQKRRLELPLDEAERLCAGILPERDLDELDRLAASEVAYMVHAMHLAPACITTYQRKAFVGGRYDLGLRITFDTDCGGRAHALQVNQEAQNHLFLSPDWCIMEVKVNDSVPDWVTSLLARHACQLRRVSKYCAVLARARDIRVMPLAIWPASGESAPAAPTGDPCHG